MAQAVAFKGAFEEAPMIAHLRTSPTIFYPPAWVFTHITQISCRQSQTEIPAAPTMEDRGARTADEKCRRFLVRIDLFPYAPSN